MSACGKLCAQPALLADCGHKGRLREYSAKTAQGACSFTLVEFQCSVCDSQHGDVEPYPLRAENQSQANAEVSAAAIRRPKYPQVRLRQPQSLR